MAKAPRPGVTTRNEQADAAKKILRMTIRGETRTLAIGNVPLQERLICRKATGLPLEAFIGGEDHFGEDSLLVLWWLAGRAAGDPFLTLTQVEEAWPAGLEADDLDIEIDEPDEADADPQPLGPVS